jgi:hypothetical protein
MYSPVSSSKQAAAALSANAKASASGKNFLAFIVAPRLFRALLFSGPLRGAVPRRFGLLEVFLPALRRAGDLAPPERRPARHAAGIAAGFILFAADPAYFHRRQQKSPPFILHFQK